jgi:hypothetical protein
LTWVGRSDLLNRRQLTQDWERIESEPIRHQCLGDQSAIVFKTSPPPSRFRPLPRTCSCFNSSYPTKYPPAGGARAHSPARTRPPSATPPTTTQRCFR